MERRKFKREKRRLTCELHSEGQKHSGIVLDLSPRGLFVKTSAALKVGVPVRLVMRTGDAEFEVEAEVARRINVPQHLRRVVTQGVGLRILMAPEGYYQLLNRN